MGHYHQPDKFIQVLYDLLDFYADRTRKLGQSATPPPVIRSFNVPNPIIRQITTELQPKVEADPQGGINLYGKLWDEQVLEFRLIAASILGFLPLDVDEDIFTVIEEWSKDCREDHLIKALTGQSLARYRKEDPEALVPIIEKWLTSTEITRKRIGLRALIPLISNQDFENIPVFYKLLTPYVRSAPPQLKPDVLDTLQALAGQSPLETAYFLSSNLNAPDNPNTAWFIRRSLDYFPDDSKDFLRSALRTAKNTS